MLFKAGDIFASKSLRSTGMVTKSTSHIERGNCRTTYEVIWQTSGLIGTYEHSQIKDDWVLAPTKASQTFREYQQFTLDAINEACGLSSQEIYGIMAGGVSDLGKTKVGCTHSWKTYDSGFSTFEYCQHCDKKREQND